MSLNKFQKLLDVIVKFASLAITAPVTFTLGLQVFADMGYMLQLMLALLAVVLVEGVFLSNWLLLEEKRNNTPDQKVRYALTIIVLYFALLGVAIQHGEGWAGVTFRLALGLAIAGSTWDTITYSVRKSLDQTSKEAKVAPRVKRNMRKCNIQEAVEQRQSSLRIRKAQIKAAEEVALYNTKVEKEKALHNITSASTITLAPNHNGNGHHPKVTESVPLKRNGQN